MTPRWGNGSIIARSAKELKLKKPVTQQQTQRKRKRDSSKKKTANANKKRKITINNNVKITQNNAKSTKNNSNLTSSKILSMAKERNNLQWYNQLISENAKRKKLSLALQLFGQLKEEGHNPNVFTYTTVVNACVRGGNISEALKIFNEMIQNNVNPNAITYTALIKGYLDINLDISQASKLLERMKSENLQPNIRTYNTLLRGCLKIGDLDSGRKFYNEVIEKHSDQKDDKNKQVVEPDQFTLKTMAELLIQHFQLEEAQTILNQLESKYSVNPSVYLQLASANALVNQKQNAKLILKKLTSLPLQPSEIKEKALVEKYISSKKNIFSGERGAKNSPRVLFLPQQNGKKIKWGDFKWFDKNKPINLEVCTGSGEWIVERCIRNSDANWVALEQRFDRVNHIWTRMALNNVSNLMILCGEATAIFNKSLSNSSIDNMFVNFPNPPGESENSRLFNDSFVKEIHRVIKKGSKVSILTDDKMYADTIRGLFVTDGKFKESKTKEVSDHDSFFDNLWKSKGRLERFLVCFEKDE